VFDRDAHDGGMPEMINRIVEFKPDLFGIPIFTVPQSLTEALAITNEVRSKLPNTTIVAGGPHVTACPEETLDWFPAVDFVLQGEADDKLCQLVEQLESNASQPQVPGLCYRSDGQNVVTPPGPPPPNLDSIPIPDRKLLWYGYEKKVYWRIGRRGIADIVITSRGCPFNCRFCFKVEKRFRYRSPDNVVNELLYLNSLGIRSIDLEDDLWTVPKSRCLEICRLIRDAGLRLDLKVRSRVDTIDEEMLAEMRKIGVTSIVYGFESGSQPVLDAMGKKTQVQRNYEVVRMTKKAGILCFADMFLGFPGETPETLAETERFLVTARPTAINMGCLTPFPGTQVYLEAKKKGMLVGDWAIGSPPPYVKLDWMTDWSSLIKFHSRIMRRYYTHPLVLLGTLRSCMFKIGPRQWLSGFRLLMRMVRR